MSIKRKKYATAHQPTVNAVLKSLHRFANRQQAVDCLNQLRKNFITSKHFAPESSQESIILWIRDYALTEEEFTQGYLGNYATITWRAKDRKFSLIAEKLPTALSLHPQRKRPKREHPDWGHPILRAIKKHRVYVRMEDAANELRQLHEEYPTISIPDEYSLMIILYEKLKGEQLPVQKYKFEVQSIAEGGYIIDFKRNTKPKRSLEGKRSNELYGHFTSMITLRRKRKPRKPT